MINFNLYLQIFMKSQILKEAKGLKAPVKVVKKEKSNPASDFFSNILNKTKGLLIDDLDGKNEY